MSLIARGKPRGHEVREMRERAGYTGPNARARFADVIRCSEQQLKNWESGRYDIPDDTWLLIRITCDPLARAEWERQIPRRKGKP